MQLRMSPGGRMRFSRRKRPELPPSSVTVTIAARSEIGRSAVASSSGRRTTCSFRPRSKVESPVPPPSATTRKPVRRAFAEDARFFILAETETASLILQERIPWKGCGNANARTQRSLEQYYQSATPRFRRSPVKPIEDLHRAGASYHFKRIALLRSKNAYELSFRAKRGICFSLLPYFVDSLLRGASGRAEFDDVAKGVCSGANH